MESTNKGKETRRSSYFHVILFTGILSVFFVLLILLPKSTTSNDEKRSLAVFPSFSIKNIQNGSYMKGLDNYVSDHFPFRTFFLAKSTLFNRLKGFSKKEESFYTNVTQDKEEEKSGLAEQINFENQEEKTRNSKGLLVYNSQAFEIFSNEEPLYADYKKMVRSFSKLCMDTINLYTTIVPTSSEFQLPKRYKSYQGKEFENIQRNYKNIKSFSTPIYIEQELLKHKKQAIYFRTDHHWTSLGAYYGYVAFCKQTNKTPIRLNEMIFKYVTGDFLGTLYLKTKNISLENHPDKIKYWIPPMENKAVNYEKGRSREIEVFKTKNIDINKYLVFLGGDKPFLKIKSKTIRNGKTILIIKNSYGNPFVGYFTANYENVFVVDYRYTETSIRDIIKNHSINDLLLLNSIYSANSPTHLKRLMDIIDLDENVINEFKPKRKVKIEPIENDSIPKQIHDTLENIQ